MPQIQSDEAEHRIQMSLREDFCRTKNIANQELPEVSECKCAKGRNTLEMLHAQADEDENQIQISLHEEICTTKNIPRK
jgi:hypothetical protein